MLAGVARMAAVQFRYDRRVRAHLTLLALALAACADDAGPPPGTPTCVGRGDGGAMMLARPILGLDPADVGANRAQLPAGFTGPQNSACSTDATRGFLAELADHAVTDARVPYEWGPVVAGPLAARPVVRAPGFFVAGEARTIEPAGTDLLFTHPFGLDTNFDVRVDPEFAGLVRAGGEREDPDALHAEIEAPLMPTEALGLPLREGDRVLLWGAWILDCGHPPYGAELHPPTFVASARAVDAVTTESLALVNPYRVSQLFSHDASTVTDFEDDARFAAATPFPEHIVNEFALAALNRSQRIEAHALLEATRFETLRWQVCAPSPRPAGAGLAYTSRFTARSGVTVSATPSAETGCVRFVATMGAAYRPLAPERRDREYPWDQISRDASGAGTTSIDVRARAVAALRAMGLPVTSVAFEAATAPYIDAYAPPAMRPDAARATPTGVTAGADDQPFPFYGRVTVRWCAG
jgi:hypothetical protein